MFFRLSWYRKYCLSNKNTLQQPNKPSCTPDETLHAHHYVSPMLLTDSHSFEVDLAHDMGMFGANSRGNTSISNWAKPLPGKPIPISCSVLCPSLLPGYCSVLFARLALAAFGWKRQILPGARQEPLVQYLPCSQAFILLLPQMVLQSDLLFAEQRSGALLIGLSLFLIVPSLSLFASGTNSSKTGLSSSSPTSQCPRGKLCTFPRKGSSFSSPCPRIVAAPSPPQEVTQSLQNSSHLLCRRIYREPSPTTVGP